MRTPVLVLVLAVGMLPTATVAQVPRDPPPPSIQSARRERELRATVASGGATRETYLELLTLELAQGRFDDAVAALRGAADLEPAAPETQYTLGTIAWTHANRDVTGASGRMLFILEGLELENRALRLKPDYTDAMTYKSILLRMQADVTTDAAIQSQLIADANTLRNRVLELKGQQPASAGGGPASFSGFGESFDQSVATLRPVRVGGSIPQPAKTRDVRPTYPAEAQKDGVQGVVIILALIGPDGLVANARILRSIPMLDDAALSAVSRWEFTPTVVNGVPAAVLMTVTVGFTLQTAR